MHPTYRIIMRRAPVLPSRVAVLPLGDAVAAAGRYTLDLRVGAAVAVTAGFLEAPDAAAAVTLARLAALGTVAATMLLVLLAVLLLAAAGVTVALVALPAATAGAVAASACGAAAPTAARGAASAAAVAAVSLLPAVVVLGNRIGARPVAGVATAACGGGRHAYGTL